MNNKLDNEYKNSESSIDEESGIGVLSEELCEPDMIDWLQDEIEVYDFHSDKEFLDSIKNSGFDKVYYISVYPHDIDKYKNIDSVYKLLMRCKHVAGIGKLQLVIFRKGKDGYLSKEDADKFISDYVDEYLVNTEKSRKEIINVLKDTHNVSDLGDEKLRERLIEYLNTEPTYGRILSNGGKYKYLVGGGKGSHSEAGKYYINLMKENGINMIEIK